MATYYVSTNAFTQFNPGAEPTTRSRVLIIEADSYEYTDGNYQFYKSAAVAKKARVVVASVNPRDVLAITEKDAFQADFLTNLDDEEGDDEDCGDECLECRAAALTDTDAFREEVFSLIDFWHEPYPEAEEAADRTPTPTAVPDQVQEEPLAKLEYRRYIGESGLPSWGVSAEGYFVPFGEEKGMAEDLLKEYKPGAYANWGFSHIEECPLVEVPSE